MDSYQEYFTDSISNAGSNSNSDVDYSSGIGSGSSSGGFGIGSGGSGSGTPIQYLNNDIEKELENHTIIINSNANPVLEMKRIEDNKKYNFFERLLVFLFTNPQNTILASATALAIGFGIKELLDSFAANCIKPGFIKLLLLLQINKIVNLDDLISRSETQRINSYTLSGAFLNFIMLILVLYFANLFSSNAFFTVNVKK
jgi:hypothetical protein